jgi:hypothetical protein
METQSSRASNLKEIAEWIQGISAMTKALFVLAAVLIAGVGGVLIAVYEFPPKPEPLPNPVQPIIRPESTSSAGQNKITPITNNESTALDVSGTWYNEQNEAINLEQYETTIQLSMAGQSDGIAYELIGSGVMADQSVHFSLDYRSLGTSFGQVPADITFVNSHKAILSVTILGIPISGHLHR